MATSVCFATHMGSLAGSMQRGRNLVCRGFNASAAFLSRGTTRDTAGQTVRCTSLPARPYPGEDGSKKAVDSDLKSKDKQESRLGTNSSSGRSERKRLEVVHITPEISPFSRAGDLGDSVRSLARAQLASQKSNLGITIVTPKYDCAKYQFTRNLWIVACMTLLIGTMLLAFNVWTTEIEGLEGASVYLIEPTSEDLRVFWRDTGVLFGEPNDDFRLLIFTACAVHFLNRQLGISYDIMHMHGSLTASTAMIMAAERKEGTLGAPLAHTKLVLTLESVSHQGIVAPELIGANGLGLSPEMIKSVLITSEHPMFDASQPSANILAGGVRHADRLVFISEAFAKSVIKGNSFGLEALFSDPEVLGKTSSIISGVDYDVHNPLIDSAIPKNYGPACIWAKEECKSAVMEEVGLKYIYPGMVFWIVGNKFSCTHTKPGEPLVLMLADGTDPNSLMNIWAAVCSSRCQGSQIIIALLGNGLKHDCIAGGKVFEDELKSMVMTHLDAADKIRVVVHPDDTLLRRLYAGADIVVMASSIEPYISSACRTALAYGAIPITFSKDGLGEVKPDGNGLQAPVLLFPDNSIGGIIFGMENAIGYHFKRNIAWWRRKVVPSAMDHRECNWQDCTAAAYLRLYRDVFLDVSKAADSEGSLLAVELTQSTSTLA